jgi:hypothetical protein
MIQWEYCGSDSIVRRLRRHSLFLRLSCHRTDPKVGFFLDVVNHKPGNAHENPPDRVFSLKIHGQNGLSEVIATAGAVVRSCQMFCDTRTFRFENDL